jgi:iron(III) transport system substrate-binding protein
MVDRTRRRWIAAATGALLIGAAAVGCAPPSDAETTGSDSPRAVASASVDADFDLDQLIAAAKKEGSLTVYDSSGDVVEAAKAFQATYGIRTTGVKSKVADTLEKMTRENQSDNVTIDAVLYEDGPSLVGQLQPQGIVYTWLPADLSEDVVSSRRNPLDVLDKAEVFTYNTKLYPDGCPIDSVWDLTRPKWAGKLAMQDPLAKPVFIEFFNELEAGANQELADSYHQEFGTEIPGGQENAAKTWIKRIAAADPILTTSDGDAEDAVAAANQTEPRIGLISNAKFRDVKAKGYPMEVCTGLDPWPGLSYPKFAAIASKSPHQQAAQLFVRFMLTEKGIETENYDGGTSPNKKVSSGPNPPGLKSFDELFEFDHSRLADDFAETQQMQDFWRANHG